MYRQGTGQVNYGMGAMLPHSDTRSHPPGDSPAGVALLAAPFVISSRYVDQRGITIPGKVFSKRETVTLRYSSWTRDSEATIEYWPADESGTLFYTARLTPERYDSLHKGETVTLRYLRRQDTPNVPWRICGAQCTRCLLSV